MNAAYSQLEIERRIKRMVHKVNDVKVLLKISKKDIIISEKVSPRRSNQGKIYQRYEFIRIIRFSKGVIGVAKIASSLERLYGLFSQVKEKMHREKTPQKLSQGKFK